MIAKNTPQLSGPRLLLWRSWGTEGLHRTELRSMVVSYTWVPGVNKSAHLPPLYMASEPSYNLSGECCCRNCGFYGHYKPAVTVSHLWGAILTWGRIALHATGARARYAQVVGFWRYEDTVKTLVYGPELKLVQALAEKFQVPYYSAGIQENVASMEYFRTTLLDGETDIFAPLDGEEALSQLRAWLSAQ